MPQYNDDIKHLVHQLNTLSEDAIEYAAASKLRSIGNSKGLILPNDLLNIAGITPEAALSIHAAEGIIIITASSQDLERFDLSLWDRKFKDAFKKDATKDNDLWKGAVNRFDKEEW